MKIVKPMSFGVLQKPYRHRGRHYLAVSGLGFFRLGAGHEKNPEQSSRFLPDNLQWQKILASLPADRPLDEIMPKARGEALLAGRAFAPGGQPVPEMTVRMQVGGIDKSLRVIGEREWNCSMIPLYEISAPQPFAEMPLDYARAFGAAGYVANPEGRGYTGNPLAPLVGSNHGSMPNIEYPDDPVTCPARRYRPAGFGPLGLAWSPRKEKLGDYGRRWLEHDAPGLAGNLDWEAFNAAPQDQWLDGHWQGGEPYRLEGLHPQRPVIEGKLPRAQARAFVQRKGQPEPEEVAMRQDTVWFFPEHELGLLLWHGRIEIGDAEAQDVAAVMIAYEHPDAPKSTEHYRAVFALRTDPETAGLHAFNESQLAPAWNEAEQARRSARRQQAEAAEQARQAALQAEQQREFQSRQAQAVAGLPQQATSATPAAAVETPAATPKAPSMPQSMPRISADAIEDCDFDLSEIVAAAKALGAQAQAAAQEKVARAQQDAEMRRQQIQAQTQSHTQAAESSSASEPPAPAPADLTKQRAQAHELACVPAYDLLPPEQQRRVLDIRVESMAARLAGQSGQPLSAEKREELRQGLLQQSQGRRKARNAAPKPTAPAQPLAAAVARWLGEQVLDWHRGGALLAGRDLAGADLRGMDFSGADLREVMLERANLSGALFDGANLTGAVLTGALFDGADFSGACLAEANLGGSQGRGACFAGADLRRVRAGEADWSGADLREAMLDDCLAIKIRLDGACLQRASLARAVLLEAHAERSDWREARMEMTVLSKAVLSGADFSGAALQRVVLMDALLAGSLWSGARLKSVFGGGKADWSRARLGKVRAEQCGWHGACMAGAEFGGARMLSCDFGNCDFSGALLRDGLFSASLFMGAKLHRADCENADFFQALGRKADFTGANLRSANLVQMDLAGAVFTDACLENIRLEKQRRVA